VFVLYPVLLRKCAFGKSPNTLDSAPRRTAKRGRPGKFGTPRFFFEHRFSVDLKKGWLWRQSIHQRTTQGCTGLLTRTVSLRAQRPTRWSFHEGKGDRKLIWSAWRGVGMAVWQARGYRTSSWQSLSSFLRKGGNRKICKKVRSDRPPHGITSVGTSIFLRFFGEVGFREWP